MFTSNRVGSISVNSERRPNTVDKDNRSQKNPSIKLRNAIIALCILFFMVLVAVTIWTLVAKGENLLLHNKY